MKNLLEKSGNLPYHLLALLTVMVWGTTFVSTKILINSGLSPVEVLLFRFLIAYVAIWSVAHKQLFAKNWKDELLLLACGICGGSLFFVAQNSALGITLATNVSLLTCMAPIATSLLGALVFKEKLHRNIFYGSCVALVGVALVVFNGSYMLKLNPLGDLLAFFAAVLWGGFSILLRYLGQHYNTFFINRKVFFYGIVTLLLYLCIDPIEINFTVLKEPSIYLNLIFLGVVASLLGNVMFTTAINKLGASTASNYIYFNPLITLITSIIVLSEQVTVASLVGAVAIVGGVYLSDRR